MKTGTAIEVIGYREVLNAVYGEGCPTASAFCGNALHLQKGATGIVPLVDLGVKIVGTGIEHVGYREVLNAVYGKGCPTASAFCGNALQIQEGASGIVLPVNLRVKIVGKAIVVVGDRKVLNSIHGEGCRVWECSASPKRS